ncbi:hypothetical protein LBR04_18770 [Levilactobacillus brevis]|uniref:hypothetical protein n=1 Tax=Levilactobacillus brevis TaxID=1580 RepID=UPI0011424CA8|nr:hypothetical protein [Levilactobacillus brevis]GEB75138.1 hypothetical protein LBR04_18770 [Levilactobacillus brevis]
MEKLIIRADVTWQEIDERVDDISKRAHEINQMSDRQKALKEFRELRDYVESDMHELKLSRNSEVLDNCAPLHYYHLYGTHIHFEKFDTEHLVWNLDEFDQAKKWYEASVSRAYILIEGIPDYDSTVFIPTKPMNPYTVDLSPTAFKAYSNGKHIQLQAHGLATQNVRLEETYGQLFEIVL